MKAFTTQDYEFYPTPAALANKMWDKFKDKDYTRVLEPSAGSGNLIKAMPRWDSRCRGSVEVDVCELDMGLHPLLKEMPGVNIVGLDFLEFGDGAAYSHILLNPPFSQGVAHVLKAWSIGFDCEIVALLNAQSIKNPTAKEGRMLCNLIAQHGHVEFIQDAFLGEDVLRETGVEVALIYLKKSAGLDSGFAESLLSELQSEDISEKADAMVGDYAHLHELTIPKSEIENAVTSFDIAVKVMKESVIAEAKAAYFEARLGQTMANRMSQQNEVPKDTSSKWVRTTIAERYSKLKDRSWATMLRSGQFTSKLSSKAQRRFESEFEAIKKLEFTVRNIYGFLCGILDRQWEMQLDMACDIFDEITKYSPDNSCFYKGYVSNAKHKTCGYRLKSTRFILPGNTAYFSGSLSYEAQRRLEDFDKVFGMLDGKTEPYFGLAHAFNNQIDELKAGARVSTEFFDCRLYVQAGTIHFYVKSKEVIDRLNKLVGQHRKWLPQADEKVSPNFWKQYDMAEKLDKEVKAAVDQVARKGRYWDNPLRSIFSSHDADKGHAVLDSVLDNVLEKHGIPVDFALTHESADQPQLLLLAA